MIKKCAIDHDQASMRLVLNGCTHSLYAAE